MIVVTQLKLDIPLEFRLENWLCLHEAGQEAISRGNEIIETQLV